MNNTPMVDNNNKWDVNVGPHTHVPYMGKNSFSRPRTEDTTFYPVDFNNLRGQNLAGIFKSEK